MWLSPDVSEDLGIPLGTPAAPGRGGARRRAAHPHRDPDRALVRRRALRHPGDRRRLPRARRRAHLRPRLGGALRLRQLGAAQRAHARRRRDRAQHPQDAAVAHPRRAAARAAQRAPRPRPSLGGVRPAAHHEPLGHDLRQHRCLPGADAGRRRGAAGRRVRARRARAGGHRGDPRPAGAARRGHPRASLGDGARSAEARRRRLRRAGRRHRARPRAARPRRPGRGGRPAPDHPPHHRRRRRRPHRRIPADPAQTRSRRSAATPPTCRPCRPRGARRPSRR